MAEELISIIIPVYNVEEYLSVCLDSVLSQTYKHIEIIVINDGSTDNSGNICDEYAKKDIRIKVFHQSNKGLAAARNIGLSHAQGKYIGFVDPDDLIAPDMYHSLYNEITNNQADIAICDMYIMIDNNVYSTKKRTGTIELLTNKEALLDLLIENKIQTSACDKLYKKDILQTDPFLKGSVYEDLRFMPDIFIKCKKIVYINSPYYYYRCFRNGSICNSLSTKNLTDLFEASIFRNNRIKETDPNLVELVCRSQIVYDTLIYRNLAHRIKSDPKAKELALKIQKDIKQYTLSQLLRIPVVRRPSAIILSYFPKKFIFYAFIENAICKFTKRKIFYMIRYYKVK